MTKRLLAEFLGTFWLVFGGCGSAVLAAAYPELGIGFAGVALAFGLTVLTMAYAVGGISGGHFNPAVSVGLFAAGKFDGKDLAPYVVAQLVGAILAALALYLVVSGKSDFTSVGGKRPLAGPFFFAATSGDQTKNWPPLAEMVEPVMKPASSAVRNSTARAISSGRPRRPTGTLPTMPSRISCGIAFTSAVSQ